MKYTFILTAAIMAAICCPAEDAPPLSMNSSAIKSWASGVQNITYGIQVSPQWKTPTRALGPATGDTTGGIVCLGRSGQITLTFPKGISNGPGYDFAVFENGFEQADGWFLELAWVEVSTDGIHFVRMYNLSQTPSPVPGFGGIQPYNIQGLASAYVAGQGTQFDLGLIQAVYNHRDSIPLSSAYRSQLLNNFPYLDLNNIQYVRIIDIVGNGSAKDAYGDPIYDPYQTFGSAGFDLDGVAVLNEAATGTAAPNTFINWSFTHGLSGTANNDADGDGSSDLEEYLQGSNPTNLTDTALFTGTATAGQVKISFNRDPSALGNIAIETSTNLTEWATATPASSATNGTAVTAIFQTTSSNRFFRLLYSDQ